MQAARCTRQDPQAAAPRSRRGSIPIDLSCAPPSRLVLVRCPRCDAPGARCTRAAPRSRAQPWRFKPLAMTEKADATTARTAARDARAEGSARCAILTAPSARPRAFPACLAGCRSASDFLYPDTLSWPERPVNEKSKYSQNARPKWLVRVERDSPRRTHARTPTRSRRRGLRDTTKGCWPSSLVRIEGHSSRRPLTHILAPRH